MKFLYFALIICSLYNLIPAYVFPISLEQTNLLSNLKIPFWSSEQKDENLQEDVEIGPLSKSAIFFKNTLYVANITTTVLIKYLVIGVTESYSLVNNNLPILKDQFIYCLQFLPIFKKEEKVKADSKLYLLFIFTSLAIYMGLYIYFTKKLFRYYQARLREQYLNNVKKVFKKNNEN